MAAAPRVGEAKRRAIAGGEEDADRAMAIKRRRVDGGDDGHRRGLPLDKEASINGVKEPPPPRKKLAAKAVRKTAPALGGVKKGTSWFNMRARKPARKGVAESVLVGGVLSIVIGFTLKGCHFTVLEHVCKTWRDASRRDVASWRTLGRNFGIKLSGFEFRAWPILFGPVRCGAIHRVDINLGSRLSPFEFSGYMPIVPGILPSLRSLTCQFSDCFDTSEAQLSPLSALVHLQEVDISFRAIVLSMGPAWMLPFHSTVTSLRLMMETIEDENDRGDWKGLIDIQLGWKKESWESLRNLELYGFMFPILTPERMPVMTSLMLELECDTGYDAMPANCPRGLPCTTVILNACASTLRTLSLGPSTHQLMNTIARGTQPCLAELVFAGCVSLDDDPNSRHGNEQLLSPRLTLRVAGDSSLRLVFPYLTKHVRVLCVVYDLHVTAAALYDLFMALRGTLTTLRFASARGGSKRYEGINQTWLLPRFDQLRSILEAIPPPTKEHFDDDNNAVTDDDDDDEYLGDGEEAEGERIMAELWAHRRGGL